MGAKVVTAIKKDTPRQRLPAPLHGLAHMPVSAENVEIGVLPVVDALWALEGVETYASCHGHFEDGDSPRILPYIAFTAPVVTATVIADLLNVGGIIEGGDYSRVLKCSWDVRLGMGDDGGPHFNIRADDRYLRLPRPQLTWFGFGRVNDKPAEKAWISAIDGDLEIVAEIVRNAGKVLEVHRDGRGIRPFNYAVGLRKATIQC